MPLSNSKLNASLNQFNSKQIKLAGQRYTPGVEPGAPNLKIESLLTAIESVTCGQEAKERFSRFIVALIEAWGRAKSSCEKRDNIQIEVDALSVFADTLLPRMLAKDTTALDDWGTKFALISNALEVELTRWRDVDKTTRENQDEEGRQHTHSSTLNTIQSSINDIRKCIGLLRDEKEFISSPQGKALVDPFLLIRGEWGTGKTHLLCDITQYYINQQQPTLLILAKNFQGSKNLLGLLCDQVFQGVTPIEAVDYLQHLGVSSGSRSLIIIDGVNEGRRTEWRQVISELLVLVRERTHVGLVVSCRTPFEHVAIPEHDLMVFHEVTHHGFEDQEFDAQAAFFQYYKLPLPEVPLLDSEFSRPLTLKLICQSLKDLTGRKLNQGFSGIASGQKGMTFVLESFVNRVGKSIEKEFSLPAKACWGLLKGGAMVTDRRVAGFAPHMAATLREYVLPQAANRILNAHFPTLSKKRLRELLDILRTNGLIDEDVVWYSSGKEVKSRVVYRLPYQRFSDHLIARHLLDAYLNTVSEKSVKDSFAYGKPLGRIFRSRQHSSGYARIGWAQALITEFPERVKKTVPRKRRELFFFLPRAAQRTSLYFEPFVEGLFWRDPSTFTEGTRRVINACLSLERYDAWSRVVDALVAVSTKPKHPYHSMRLYQFLSRMSMPTRDIHWSEYLRKRYTSPAIQRLLAWAERLKVAEMSEDAARKLVVLLSLLLTSVVHKDRDVTTKALVVIGERYPKVLFEHVVVTLDFNDPYVSERMLAAAYGVTLSLADTPVASTFLPHLGVLTKQLYRKMFTPKAPCQTHHVLRRDYALGIIQLAQRGGCNTLPKASSKYLSPPFAQIQSTFKEMTSANNDVLEDTKHAIHMDFGNYTIGRLIPNRANYDDNKPDYIVARAQIEQRIYDLGYRKKLFEDIDREIGNSYSRNERDGDKVDRYGKKYSWIAYFEMYGIREANQKLPDWRTGERTSDVGIDPSFPKRPDVWNAPIPDLFGDISQNSDNWVGGGYTPDFSTLLSVPEISSIHGPWILLDGFVQGERKDIDRELFAFLRGLFVPDKDVQRIRSEFLSIDYPGNDSIPNGSEDYYLYAGEAGKCTRYAPELLMPNGRYRRQVSEAFDRYVEDDTHPKIDPPFIKRILISPPSGDRDKKDAADSENSLVIENPSAVKCYSRYRKIPGVRIEIPMRKFAWESYHSAMNDFSGFDILAPSLIQKLGLVTWNREIDFRDKDGKLASAYREFGSGWKGDHFHFLYIRKELLQAYLKSTRQKLIWCNWGERGWADKGEMGDGIRSNSGRVKILQEHMHIFRSFQKLDDLK
jgi:hypothetical protein